MASCTKVYDLLHSKPSVTQFNIHGKIDQKSVRTLLNKFTTEIMLQASKITAKDVLIYQASLSLGIHYAHTNPLLDTLCAEITSRLLSTEELSMVVSCFPPGIRCSSTQPTLSVSVASRRKFLI